MLTCHELADDLASWEHASVPASSAPSCGTTKLLQACEILIAFHVDECWLAIVLCSWQGTRLPTFTSAAYRSLIALTQNGKSAYECGTLVSARRESPVDGVFKSTRHRSMGVIRRKNLTASLGIIRLCKRDKKIRPLQSQASFRQRRMRGSDAKICL